MENASSHSNPPTEEELQEKRRLEFENLLQKQGAERETMKMKKQQNVEQNKDPKEMMLVIQKNFREKYDAINKELEEFKEGGNIDQLFLSFNDLKEYFINASYSLTLYDKRLYGEQLDKLEKSLQECREKNQPRKKFTFSKKIEKKKETENKEPILAAPQETTQTDSLSLIKGIENKTGENLTLGQNDLDASFKLMNLERCHINLHGKMKTIYLKNLKNCVINIGVIGGACFIDNCVECELQLAAHQVRIHNSNKTVFRLFATSKPIIEHCTNLKFGQYNYRYEGFDQNFAETKFTGKENLWDQVQDFNWLKQDKSNNLYIKYIEYFKIKQVKVSLFIVFLHLDALY
jgi:hypothetical protein